jgi:hypothetical protein
MAYQIVLYNEDHIILDVIKNLENVRVTTDSIEWAGGGQNPKPSNFVILDNTIPVGEKGSILTQELLSQDQKTFVKDVVQELREQLRLTQDAIDFLMGL